MDKYRCWTEGRLNSRRCASLRAAAMGLVACVLALVCAGVSWGSSIYDPATDMNSMFNTSAYTGATAFWDAGYTGKGVDVAVIDTGVSPVPGLNGTGKIVNGPDLSVDSQNTALRYLDGHGHGTFMAGLIAGHDTNLTTPYALAPASAYRGIAPDARIVNVKVGNVDGGTDVSQVIAGIDWVVQHARDSGMNIRVISLSYGTNSLQDASVDPLAYAAEQAWKKGIVVVAAAGNSGFQAFQHAGGLSDPASDPYVLAVGGTDSMGTATIVDDTVGDYSANAAACNTGCRAPDIVAPGSHLQGLRVPGSFIDQNHPEGMIDSRFFRGSGTSQATAITAGAVALILQKYPKATPDQVKAYINTSAFLLPGYSTKIKGNGELNLTAALASSLPTKNYAQTFTAATGTGSLELSRGSDYLTLNGVVLTGERDIFGHDFNSSSMATLEAAGTSWSGGTWNGNSWSGNTWSGNSWSGNTWSGNSWSGNSWSGNTWSGNTWSGNSWSGNTWSGNTWSGNTWSGNTWSGGYWG